MSTIWHNPNNLTQEQLQPEDGWRFLLPSEIDGRWHTDIEFWDDSQWQVPDAADADGWYAVEEDTFRTKRPLPAGYDAAEQKTEIGDLRERIERLEQRLQAYFDIEFAKGIHPPIVMQVPTEFPTQGSECPFPADPKTVGVFKP